LIGEYKPMKHYTDQVALTVIAGINDADFDVLTERLARINDEIRLIGRGEEDKALLPFSKIKGIHFCRFVILPAFQNDKGVQVPPQLVYSSNIDVSLDAHLKAIRTSGAAAGFAAVFSCCKGYQTSGTAEDGVEAFIRRNKKKVHTFYRAYRGLSVDIIESERVLNETIQAHLQSKSFRDLPVADIKKDIEAHVAHTLPDRKDGEVIKLTSYSMLKTAGLLLVQLILPLAAILVAAHYLHIFWYALAAIIALIIAGVIYLRHLENHDPELPAADKNYEKIRGLVAMEDKIVQNQLTHLAVIKRGAFRRTLQALALWALDKLAIYNFNKGKLGGIGTIHFARWSIIDGGQRLLFFSNFDGSWENYLGDFVDRAAFGLTLAWSNNEEFPRTKWLVTKGAANEELFKSWARKYQQPTQVWYSAYKNLTVSNIYRNHRIALGIGKSMNDQEIKEWLKLF
jgi:hypothetical protein